MGQLERSRELDKDGNKVPFRKWGGAFDSKKMHNIDIAHLKGYLNGQDHFRYGMDNMGKPKYRNYKR